MTDRSTDFPLNTSPLIKAIDFSHNRRAQFMID
jgi:hypothetical protein